MNGGYFMINANGLDLTKGNTSQTVAGLYQSIKTGMIINKPIQLYNVIYGTGKPTSPVSVFAYQYDSTHIYAIVGIYQIKIANNDTIVIASLAS